MAANVGHGHDIGLDVGVDCRNPRGASSSLGTREPLRPYRLPAVSFRIVWSQGGLCQKPSRSDLGCLIGPQRP